MPNVNRRQSEDEPPTSMYERTSDMTRLLGMSLTEIEQLAIETQVASYVTPSRFRSRSEFYDWSLAETPELDIQPEVPEPEPEPEPARDCWCYSCNGTTRYLTRVRNIHADETCQLCYFMGRRGSSCPRGRNVFVPRHGGVMVCAEHSHSLVMCDACGSPSVLESEQLATATGSRYFYRVNLTEESGWEVHLPNATVCNSCVRRGTSCRLCGNRHGSLTNHRTGETIASRPECNAVASLNLPNPGDSDGALLCQQGTDFLTALGRSVGSSYDRFSILNYSFKPTFKFRGKGPFFLGMENEVTFPRSVDLNGAIRDFQEISGKWTYLKSDCSIPYGFEIVSHPLDVDYWSTKYPMDEAYAKLQEHGGMVDDHCGIHIHINRSGFTPDAMFRFLTLWFRNHEEMRVLAGRPGSASYCQWTNRSWAIGKSKHDLVDRRTNSETVPDFSTDLGRYSALNTSGRETIEVRAFANSVTPAAIRARLQLVAGTAAYASLPEMGKVVDEKDDRLSFEAFKKYVESTNFKDLNDAIGNISSADLAKIRRYDRNVEDPDRQFRANPSRHGSEWCTECDTYHN